MNDSLIENFVTTNDKKMTRIVKKINNSAVLQFLSNMKYIYPFVIVIYGIAYSSQHLRITYSHGFRKVSAMMVHVTSVRYIYATAAAFEIQ